VLDDLVDVDRGGRGVGADEGHAEGPVPPERLFHLGHDLQGFLVGGKQQLEVVIPLFEFGLDRLFGQVLGGVLRGGVGEKPRQHAP